MTGPDPDAVSPCHGAKIGVSLADGVLVGHCVACFAFVCRLNPQRGRAEWLDGASPWTDAALRPMEWRETDNRS